MHTVLIGALADTTGVPAKTLRYWEAGGLLREPERTDGGYRDYPDETVDRVAFIRYAQAAGLSLREIGQIIAIRDHGKVPCTHAADLVDERLQDVDVRLRNSSKLVTPSHYNLWGEYQFGPAPRGLDRFAVSVEEGPSSSTRPPSSPAHRVDRAS